MGEATTLLEPLTQPGLETRVDYLEQLYASPVYEEARPLVLSVSEMLEETAVRTQTSEFIGAVLTKRLVEIEPSVESPIENLYQGIKRAAEGDKTALKMVETNATTDIIERTFKSGFVSKPVKLERTLSGGLVQHNQSVESVQANSLRLMAYHPVMGPRTKAEARNYFRTTTLDREGYFDEGYSYVVFSPADDLPEAGFFTESMSCAIQITSKTENGLQVEPAFISGIKDPNEERHDLKTIKTLYNSLGVDVDIDATAKIIDTPLLIHNSLMPNGVIDIVKMFDDCAGGTFFGEDKPRQDYIEYVEKCYEKEKNFIFLGKQIAAELVSQADTINSDTEATKRLNKISGRHAVIYATGDISIDSRVFGPAAAEHIERSRRHIASGALEAAYQERLQAIMTETSSSCPTAVGLLGETESGQDQYGSLSFKCPACGATNIRTHGKLMNRCQHCESDVTCG